MAVPRASSSSSSFWHSAIADLANHRTTETLPPETDIVIIGSGFSGASTAYYLLAGDGRRNPPSVCILEARQACSGATGRNGGHLKPDAYYSAMEYEERFGTEVAEDMTAFENQQVWDVKELVEKENIDCDFQLTRAIDVFTDKGFAESTIKKFKEMKARGFKFPKGLHLISDPKSAEHVSGVKGALAAFTFTAGSLWPYKLVSHLLRRSIECGVNLQTNTPVEEVLRNGADNNGRGWVVRTSRGDICAKNVIVASNAYTAALFPQFRDKIVPVKGVACRIAVPEGSGNRAPHLNNTYAIRYGPQHFDYLISRADGSIVVGGADRVATSELSHWYKNVDDSSLIPGTEDFFTGYMQRLFHGWEKSQARISHIWSGVMAFSSDSMPWVGEVPGQKGIFVTAGFGGHGMPRILGCSKALAELVLARGDKSKIQTRLPTPYYITTQRLESRENIVAAYAGKETLPTPKL
ncbi:FAD dependent oxidoreductase [Thozetella sp. PMI_491]|nr:FAD dependent oxidoreductase [Thozetella sp. PMI_491]